MNHANGPKLHRIRKDIIALLKEEELSITIDLKMINKRISDLSRNKEKFDNVKFVYETDLKDSGHISSMSFNNSNNQNSRRNRNRKVIYALTHHITKMWKQILVNCSSSLWWNPPPRTIVALPTSETSSNKLTLKCWTKQMTTTTTNVIVDENETAHWMVSVSLNV